MEPLIVYSSIAIDASAEKVWDVLVNPEQTKKYMFGCETVSDWRVGSELLWRGHYNGQELVFVKGIIKAIEPGKRLTYSTIDPNNPETPDVPENHVDVTYSLVETAGQTQLNISQGDFASVANGQKRYEETYNNGDGWNPILVQIKAICEGNG